MPARTLGLERGKLGGPTLIGGGNDQQGHWNLKGVDCEIPHWLGRRMKHSL